MKTFAAALVVACLVVAVQADIYLQSPRGSNNRLDEAKRDRNNGNRLFDSQNNNRGGYNVGSVYYYGGSTIPFEWTNQHSCGNPNNHCEMIFQYMCDEKLRDGTTTNRIPTKPIECANWDCDSDVEFGRHESFDWYKQCMYRERNKGLFTAQQLRNTNRKDARFTRQNPAGTRRGYECPEERDYYPYWVNTPWRDMAVLTNQPRKCAQYKAESQNVKGRWECKLETPHFLELRGDKKVAFIPIQQAPCEALTTTINGTTYTGKWVQMPSWGLEAPFCRDNAWSRDNHLGNGADGQNLHMNWNAPNMNNERCVFRLRYNISTGEYSAWDSVFGVQAGIDYRNNSDVISGNNNEVASNLAIWEKFNIPRTEVEDSLPKASRNNLPTTTRDYVFKNNPRVDPFHTYFGDADGVYSDSNNNNFRFRLQLAINTNQFGRTFQDRTHRLAFRERPDDIDDGATIHNIQVRGKRGNIVQTFPGTEYDFFPNTAYIKQGDYVHFQWTGSNTNPNNNAGQGKQGTDRHNVLMLRNRNYVEAGQDIAYAEPNPPTFGHFGNSYPGFINSTYPLSDLSRADLVSLATLVPPNAPAQFGGEMSELDDAGTYFDLGPRKVSQRGTFYYLSTRNNNFSNRSQKGKLIVDDVRVESKQVGFAGGDLVTSEGIKVMVPGSTLGALTTITVDAWGKDTSSSLDESVVSMYVVVKPTTFVWASDAEIKSYGIVIPFDDQPLQTAKVMWSTDINGEWKEVVRSKVVGNEAYVETDQGGVFAVTSKQNTAAVAGIVFICLSVVIGAGVFVWWKRKGRVASKGSSI